MKALPSWKQVNEIYDALGASLAGSPRVALSA
jgi:hypothetical protein